MKKLGKVRHFWLVLIVLLATSLGAHAVEPKLEDFYTYTEITNDAGEVTGYKVGLTPKFKTAFNKGEAFIDSNGFVCGGGISLPCPGIDGMYKGKKIVDMSGMFSDCNVPASIYFYLDLTLFDFTYVDKSYGFKDMFKGMSGGKSVLTAYAPSDVVEILNNTDITGEREENCLVKFGPRATLEDFYTYTYLPETDSYKVSLNQQIKDVVNVDGEETYNGYLFTKKEGSSYFFPNPARNGQYDDKIHGRHPVTDMSGLLKGLQTQNAKFSIGLRVNYFDFHTVTNLCEFFMDCQTKLIGGFQSHDLSSVTDMSNIFKGCVNLNQISFTKSKILSVTNMSGMLEDCKALTTFSNPDVTPIHVTNLSNMFKNCNALKIVDISGLNIYENTLYDDIFNGCSTSVNGTCTFKVKNTGVADKFKTSTNFPLEKIIFNYALDYDSYYTYTYHSENNGYYSVSLNSKFKEALNKSTYTEYADANNQVWHTGDAIPNPAPSGVYNGSEYGELPVTDMSGLFKDCNNITSLKIVDFLNTNITNMSSMFEGCSSLRSLNLGNFFVSNVSDMSNMFKDCSSITNLKLDRFNIDNVNVTGIFENCGTVGSVCYVPASSIDKFMDKSSKLEFKVALDVTDFYNFKIDDAWLRTGTVTLTDGFKQALNAGESYKGWTPNSPIPSPSVGGYICISTNEFVANENYKALFKDCKNVKTLNLSEFETDCIKNMSEMFLNCTSLTNIDLSNFKTSNVTDMSSMFKGCSNLINIDLSNFTTDKLTNMGSMFSGCTNLIGVDLSNFTTANVTSMRGVFNVCTSLIKIDLSNFITDNVTTTEYMFGDCSSLTNIDLSNFNFKNGVKVDYMFYHTGIAFHGIQALGYANKTAIETLYTPIAKINKSSLLFKVGPKLEELYVYTPIKENGKITGYKVSLTPEFKAQVNKVSDGEFVSSTGYVWKTGYELPDPTRGGKYNGVPVVDMSEMFKDCVNAGQLDLVRFDISNVTNMTDMFKGCGSKFGGVCSLGLALDNETVEKYNAEETGIDKTKLQFKPVPNLAKFYTYSDGKVSMLSAFATAVKNGTAYADDYGYTWSKDEPLPNPLRDGIYKGAVYASMNSMFKGYQVNKLDLRYFNTENITDMSNMFNGCSNILQLDLASFDIFDKEDGVTIRPKLDGMFTNCGKYVYGQGAAWGGAKDAATADIFNNSKLTGISSNLLKFGDVATGTDVVKAESAMVVYGAEGEVVVKPTEATVVYVYDFAGNMVATMSVAGESHIAVPAGLYVVKTPTTTTKVMVK